MPPQTEDLNLIFFFLYLIELNRAEEKYASEGNRVTDTYHLPNLMITFRILLPRVAFIQHN